MTIRARHFDEQDIENGQGCIQRWREIEIDNLGEWGFIDNAFVFSPCTWKHNQSFDFIQEEILGGLLKMQITRWNC